MEARCGRTARQLVDEIMLTSVISVEELIRNGKPGVERKRWPEQCERLKAVLISSACKNSASVILYLWIGAWVMALLWMRT